ncbi:hypothetical protein [Wohlfahrtiimonas chitiniclastica]|uniref:hypothetical protein n=1 Tax=Wohlfahrtiimonas chitiniclastica TaxID=400946 RepID=UPI0011D03986|nr:hypothetical protein [Wohlfahrtiimonas chitiniclastica]
MGKKINIFSVLCLFFLIFDPAIYPLKSLGGIPWAFCIIILAFLINPKKIFFYKKNTFGVIYLMYIIMICYSFFITCILNQYDYSYSKILIRTLMSLIMLHIYLMYFYKEDNFKVLIIIFLINSLYILISPHFTGLFNIALSVKAGEIPEALYIYNHYRVSGLTGNGFFGLVALYFIFIIFYPILKFNRNQKIAVNDIMFILVISFTSVLIGRVALLSTALAIILIVNKNRIYFFYVASLIVLMFNIAPLFLPPETLNWITEMLPNKNLEINSLSFNQLLNMYTSFDYENISMENIWLGEGRLIGDTPSSYYKNVDSGFLRNFLFGGVILCFIFIFYFYVLIRKNIEQKLNFFTIVVSLFLLEFKGTTFIVLPGFMVLLTLLLLIAQDSIYEKNLNYN